MSSSYSTTQQYAPLRVPSSFDQQGKALIVQLNETFDDIYKRFGRLRLEDMGKEFRQEWTTEQQTVITIGQNLDALVLKVRDKYDKVSGITIASEGIEISGSKYLKLLTGNTLEMQSGSEVKIMANGNANPAMTLDNLGIHMKTGGSISLEAGAGFTVSSGNFAIDSSGNATFKGGGTFSGELSAASGTFKGTVQAGSVIACEINADLITSGAINANLITTGSLYADRISGGELNFSKFTVSNLSAGMITTGDLSASRIKGGTLTLGGSGNTNGTIIMKDSSDNTIGTWNNSGLTASGTFTSQYWKMTTMGLSYETGTNDPKFYLTTYQGSDGTKGYGIRLSAGYYSGSVHPSFDFTGNDRALSIGVGDTTITMSPTANGYIRPNLEITAHNLIPQSPGSSGTSHMGNSTYPWHSIWVYNLHDNQSGSSSREVKQDILEEGDVGEIIDALVPVSFSYIKDKEKRKRHGLIWEDTIKIIPEVCINEDDIKEIMYKEFIPILLKETQSLRKRVKALEAIA